MSLPGDFRFHHRLRVRWSEVDAQQVVFNGHYLNYLDVASGDYWRTVLANQIRSVEVAKVERSEYHRQYVLPSDGDDSVVATKEVVILK